MENPMQEVARKMRVEYDDHVSKRWNVVPVGSYLCVHQQLKDDPAGNNFKMVFEVSSHVVDKSGDCEVGGHRVQFGPKGE